MVIEPLQIVIQLDLTTINGDFMVILTTTNGDLMGFNRYKW